MTRRRGPRQLWEQGGGIPGSLSGPPLPPEAFREHGGRRLPQRRHARKARVGGRQSPAWLAPTIFGFVFLALIVTIIVTA